MTPVRLVLLVAVWPSFAFAQLHQRIDQAIDAEVKTPKAARADDAEFLRRVTLDFTGLIPTADEARAFFADKTADKRTRLIDQLLKSPDYPRRMQEFFHVMLEERRNNADSPLADWEEYLLRSFETNKAWDQLAREILLADEAIGPSNKFYIDRGGDAHQITRDVGRIFLGRDMECNRCHDHPTVDDYKQSDYFGLYAFLYRSFAAKKKGTQTVLAEKFLPGKLDFESVFTNEKMMIGPRLPGGKELVEPVLAKGEEYIEKPEPKKNIPGKPKFSPRALLAQELSNANNTAFVRNSANRLWFMMMGRGVVHPLDMHHSNNPPTNPKLLDALSEGLVELKFDVKAFLREIALSQAYQRSSLIPKGAEETPEGSFAVAELRQLSPEQLIYSIGRATGHLEPIMKEVELRLKTAEPMAYEKKRGDPLWRSKAIRNIYNSQINRGVVAFGNRAGEAEVDFQPTLAGALFISNEKSILDWLKPVKGNLAFRLKDLANPDAFAEEMYLSILTRLPTAEEKAETAAHLKARGEQREQAIAELTWALISSTEFRLNH